MRLEAGKGEYGGYSGGDGAGFVLVFVIATDVAVGGAGEVEVEDAGEAVFFEIGAAGLGIEPDVEGLEDGAEAVVVGVLDGVVFVVVAFDALHGESEQGAGGVLDGFIEPGGAVEEVVAAGEVAGGAEVCAVFRGELVGGELLEDDVVVAFVGVEAFDDPVTPVPEVFLAVAELIAEAVPVAVAPDVHEVACPALSVLGRGEEAVGDLFGGCVCGVGEGGGIGREAGEIEVEAAEVDGVRGWGLGKEFAGAKVGGVEGVDGFSAVTDGLVGPVGVGVCLGLLSRDAGGSGADPCTEEGDLGGGEGGAFALWRHALVEVGGEDAVEEVLGGITAVAAGF